MSRSLACRRIRDWLQEQHDREGAGLHAAGATAAPQAAGTRPQESRLAGEAAAHLEACPDCRRFREFLSSFGRELAASLDALPRSEPRVGLQGAPAIPAVARRPAARWAIPAAAAALLAIAAGIQAPRLAAGARVQRSIRAETTALVEELFSHSLAQGVEAGLAGGSLLEGLGEGDGLQGLGQGEEPALSAGTASQ